LSCFLLSQKREEKTRELQNIANFQRDKLAATLRKMQEEKERLRQMEEEKDKDRKVKEENDRQQKEREIALKEEKKEKRRLHRLKLEQQKRRKEREKELRRESEENENILVAIERKVAVLEEQRSRRLKIEEQERREREERALREQEELALRDEEECYAQYQKSTKGQKLLSIREQSEVVVIPILNVEELYSNEARGEEVKDIINSEEIPPNELETIDNPGYRRKPSEVETLVLEDADDIEERTIYVPAHDTEMSAKDNTPSESHLVGLTSIIRRRSEKQRRDYMFPPVVNKLHKGIPTYYDDYN